METYDYFKNNTEEKIKETYDNVVAFEKELAKNKEE